VASMIPALIDLWQSLGCGCGTLVADVSALDVQDISGLKVLRIISAIASGRGRDLVVVGSRMPSSD
jgi:hypothetical protein